MAKSVIRAPEIACIILLLLMSLLILFCEHHPYPLSVFSLSNIRFVLLEVDTVLETHDCPTQQLHWRRGAGERARKRFRSGPLEALPQCLLLWPPIPCSSELCLDITRRK
jgi:hypothetical protein